MCLRKWLFHPDCGIKKKSLFILLAVLGVCCCVGFSLLGERPLAARGLLVAVASLIVEHGLWAHGFSVVALRLERPAAVAHKFPCSVTCRVVPTQGSHPCLLHW